MNFLDQASTTHYSTRAAAASGCAADQDRFTDYLHELFVNQPPEGSAGLSDTELIALGQRRRAGTRLRLLRDREAVSGLAALRHRPRRRRGGGSDPDRPGRGGGGPGGGRGHHGRRRAGQRPVLTGSARDSRPTPAGPAPGATAQLAGSVSCMGSDDALTRRSWPPEPLPADGFFSDPLRPEAIRIA